MCTAFGIFPESADVLLLGQVLKGMKPTDEPVKGEKNDPMMPLAWTKRYQSKSGTNAKIFCTTMGSSTDFECEDLRRLVVNAAFWCLELDVPEKANVEIVGKYAPTPYGFGNYKKGLRPADHELAGER